MSRVGSLEEFLPSWVIDYSRVECCIAALPLAEKITFLEEELPHLWRETYSSNLARPTEMYRLESGTFQYLFDDYDMLVASGEIADDGVSESRLVAGFGQSSSPRIPKNRDANRRKRWLGRTKDRFGENFDKGHFIAHSIGGAVDGSEYNVFGQIRNTNRGWSTAGKVFRSMEDYCLKNLGTFCFNRAIYLDGSSKPVFIEYGLLRSDGTLWIMDFDNQDRSIPVNL